MRYEIRKAGWYKGRPVDNMIAECDNLQEILKYINKNGVYVLDRLTNSVHDIQTILKGVV